MRRIVIILAALTITGVLVAIYAPRPPGGSTLARVTETWIWHFQHDENVWPR